MNSLHRVFAAWLNASHRSQVGVRMNRSAGGGELYSALSSPMDWVPRYIKRIYILTGNDRWG